MKKENTHIVIKKEDALKYLTEVEYQTLEEFMNTIIRGREKTTRNLLTIIIFATRMSLMRK